MTEKPVIMDSTMWQQHVTAKPRGGTMGSSACLRNSRRRTSIRLSKLQQSVTMTAISMMVSFRGSSPGSQRAQAKSLSVGSAGGVQLAVQYSPSWHSRGESWLNIFGPHELQHHQFTPAPQDSPDPGVHLKEHSFPGVRPCQCGRCMASGWLGRELA
jgi:hypothetical protein